jgi:hypothetical protein
VTGTESWVVGVKQSYDYNQDTASDGTLPNYHQILDFYTKQSASWINTFSLDRLLSQTLKLTLTEFSAALRFEVYYWIQSYALCLNLLYYFDKISVALTSNSNIVECKSVLIG